MNLLIAGDVIHSISKKPIPPDMKTFDATGKFIVPGLFDLHAHIQPLFSREPVGSKQTDEVLQTLLQNGITTVRALPLFSEFASESASRTNRIPQIGPTIVPSSGIFELAPQRTSWGFRDPKTARRWVQRESLLGSRWIKVHNKMDSKSLESIVSEAHQRGMKVCGHAFDVPAHEASIIGMDCIEHIAGIPLSFLKDGMSLPKKPMSLPVRIIWLWEHHDPEKAQDLLKLFKENQTSWVPTLVAIEQIAKNGGRLNGHPLKEGEAESLKKVMKQASQMVVKLHRMKGKVGLGTDFPVANVSIGESVHREMELLVQLGGSTPLEALQIATYGSARVLELEDLTGSIEVGKLADFLILKQNPLEDISNTRSIEAVIHLGILTKSNPDHSKIISTKD